MVFSSLIAVYLFLGGTSAGAYAIIASSDTMLSLRARHRGDGRMARRANALSVLEPTRRSVRRIVYATSFVMLVTGLLCLVFDLGQPGRFYFLMMHPTTSYMSVGAFALGLFAVCLLFSLCEAAFELAPRWRTATCVVKAIGIPFAVVVMVYTGLLLSSVMAVAFWQSAWLPVLFTSSALSCGCAVVMIAACAAEDPRITAHWKQVVLRADFVAIAVECVACVLFFASVAGSSGSSALPRLFTGDLAWQFWSGFVGCGIIAPLGVDAFVLVRGRSASDAQAVGAAALVLIGGLFLRLVIVASGVQTAV